MSEPVGQLRNRILRALPEEEYARLAPALERVCMESRQLAFDVDRPIDYVYFPEDCVVSIVGVTAEGSAVETASVGREGMVGLPVFLGVESTPAQAFCQIPGEALRLDTGTLQREAARDGQLRRILNRYTQALFTAVAQASACNRLHTMRQRCARWLLQTQDRVGKDEFPLTQRFLSQMLGVRRATVTEAARSLQHAGLITYVHGRITVRDRPGLERVSCECYAIIRRELERLLEGRTTPSPLDGLRVSVAGLSTAGDGASPPRTGGTAIDIEPLH
ncbi:MAG: Crp/Fnr family transcriptional regulator [Gemmatimonadaceae bacterium]